MDLVNVKLAHSPSEVYPVQQNDFDESLWLQPLNSRSSRALGYFRKPQNYLIENARVMGMSNIILNSENFACFENLVFNPRNADKIHDEAEKSIIFQQNQIQFNGKSSVNLEEAVFLGGHWNFGHWLFNHLARLCFTEAPFNDKIFLVPKTLSKNYVDLLYAAGLKKENLFFIQAGMVVYVDKLSIPQIPWHSTTDGFIWWSPGSFDHLRKILSVHDSKLEKADKLVFLSRKDTRWRRLLNEEEVFQKLKPFGFVRINIGELSMEEQIRLGRSTRYLFTPIGANSNFFLNMPTGSHVLEVAPPMDSMNVTGSFARACGINYRQIIGVPTINPKLAKIDYDYTIDLREMDKALSEFFALL